MGYIAIKLYLLYLVQRLDGTNDSDTVLPEKHEEALQLRVQQHWQLIDVSNGVQGVQTRLKRKDRFESK